MKSNGWIPEEVECKLKIIQERQMRKHIDAKMEDVENSDQKQK
jgi:hypothetical protein